MALKHKLTRVSLTSEYAASLGNEARFAFDSGIGLGRLLKGNIERFDHCIAGDVTENIALGGSPLVFPSYPSDNTSCTPPPPDRRTVRLTISYTGLSLNLSSSDPLDWPGLAGRLLLAIPIAPEFSIGYAEPRPNVLVAHIYLIGGQKWRVGINLFIRWHPDNDLQLFAQRNALITNKPPPAVEDPISFGIVYEGDEWVAPYAGSYGPYEIVGALFEGNVDDNDYNNAGSWNKVYPAEAFLVDQIYDYGPFTNYGSIGDWSWGTPLVTYEILS